VRTSARCEDTATSAHPLYVDYGSHVRIGACTVADYGVVALDVAAITIRDDVPIGTNVQLISPTRPIDPEPRRAKWEAPSGSRLLK